MRRTLTTTGVEVSPENVMILPGGKPTMYAAIIMFGEPGAEILYPDPGFPIYRSMIEFTGATPIPVPIREENGFAFSAEETLSLITPKTRLLILNSPANPTGGVTPRAEIEKLVKGLEKHPDVAIMSDEIYDVMTYDGEAHTSLLQFPEIRDRLIVLNGWSKTWAMTGWRMGWSIWPNGERSANLYDKVRKLAVNCWSCVNAPSQFAGIAAIDGPQDDVAKMMRAFDNRRKIVVEGLNDLPGVSCITPKGAFYAFPEHFEDRPQGQAAGLGAAGGRRRGADRRPGFRHSGRRLYPAVLRQLGGEYFAGAGTDRGVPGQSLIDYGLRKVYMDKVDRIYGSNVAMTVLIKNRETDALIRHVAKLKGVGLTEAVHEALENELKRASRRAIARRARSRIRAAACMEQCTIQTLAKPADKDFIDSLYEDD